MTRLAGRECECNYVVDKLMKLLSSMVMMMVMMMMMMM